MSGAPLTNKSDDLKGTTAPKIRLRLLGPGEAQIRTEAPMPSMTYMAAESSGKSGPVRPLMSATRMAVQSSGKFGPMTIFEKDMQTEYYENANNEAMLAEIFSGAQPQEKK